MQNKRGFTLIEMIVSLAVFSVVAVVALGALTKIVSANRKAQTLQASITNLNFALETISRELRVSPNYYCDNMAPSSWGVESSQDCSLTENNGEAYLSLNSTKVINPADPDPCDVSYTYGFILNDEGTGYNLKKAMQDVCGNGQIHDDDFQSVIDPNVTITGFYLNVDTSGPYALATVRLSGYAGTKERDKTYFDVQTSISPRVLNVTP
jgi:prepilin-type N-terminal cleavage/methylation domain-containing protein